MQRLREWPARADWGKAEAPASRFPRLTLPRECKGPFYHPAPRNDMWPAVSNRFLVTPKKWVTQRGTPVKVRFMLMWEVWTPLVNRGGGATLHLKLGHPPYSIDKNEGNQK